MHSSLTAVVLCIFAQSAAAQCVAISAADEGRAAANLAKQTAVIAPKAAAKAAPQPGGELIKTAAAGTREMPAPIAREASAQSPEHPQRGGTAMLLAALALMSGIALRRYGAPRQ